MAETIGHDAKVPQNSGEYGLWAGQRLCDRCWSYQHASCRKLECQCPCVKQRDDAMRERVESAFYEIADDYPPDWANIKYADELADFLDDVYNDGRLSEEFKQRAKELRVKLDRR